MSQPRFKPRLSALLLVLLMIEQAWAATGLVAPQLPHPGSVSMSRQQQQQLGLQVAAEVYKQMPVLPDSSPVSQYVQQLGKKLQTVIPAQYSWPYQFHVVQQAEINAFALPGGPIFVNLGTITASDNEAQLVGVMAHEMAHIYMQHSAKQAPKQQWANVLGVLGGLLGGPAGGLAQMGIQFGAGTLLMKYSRKDEAQADSVGAIIMYKAGYDPRAMANFFAKLEKEGGGGGPQFLSDHPNPGNRVQAVQQEIANWPPEKYHPNSPAFLQAKQDAKRVTAYTAKQIADGAKSGRWAAQNKRSGAVLGGTQSGSTGAVAAADAASLADVSYSQIKPNDNFGVLRQNTFSISYPSNWQTTGDGNSVTIAPPAGVAQNAIAYGVVISVAKIPGSIDEVNHTLIQDMQQANPGLQVHDSPRSIQAAGVEGRSTMLAGNSPVMLNGQPQPERDWLVVLPRTGGNCLFLAFIAPESDFGELRPTYERILNSLQLK
jgi:beta-barrel assembly-enhancing protease